MDTKHETEEVRWLVGWSKDSGVCARRSPGGPLDMSPSFDTRQELYFWLQERKLLPVDHEMDSWK